MARKPAPQLSDQVNHARQVSTELRIYADAGGTISPEKAGELSEKLDHAINALAASIIKARNSLTYGAEYDPLDS